MPVIFFCIIILILWIRHQVTKTKNTAQGKSEAFWKRESEANFTRNKPLDSVEFIELPIDQFPFIDSKDTKLKELQDTLISLSQEKIANLSEYTNTDLKLAYGTGNFAFLSTCDERYILLMRTLTQLGTYHYEHENFSHAIAYYEYAVTCKSENSNIYTNLALSYLKTNQLTKIEELKETIRQSNFQRKDSTLSKLEQAILDATLL